MRSIIFATVFALFSQAAQAMPSGSPICKYDKSAFPSYVHAMSATGYSIVAPTNATTDTAIDICINTQLAGLLIYVENKDGTKHLGKFSKAAGFRAVTNCGASGVSGDAEGTITHANSKQKEAKFKWTITKAEAEANPGPYKIVAVVVNNDEKKQAQLLEAPLEVAAGAGSPTLSGTTNDKPKESTPDAPGYGDQEQKPPADNGYGSQEQKPPADNGYGSQEQKSIADNVYGNEEQKPPVQEPPKEEPPKKKKCEKKTAY